MICNNNFFNDYTREAISIIEIFWSNNQLASFSFDKIFNGCKTFIEVPPKYFYKLDFVELRMNTQKEEKLVEGLVEKLVERLVEKHNLTTNQANILQMMLDKNTISIDTISKKIGISTTAVDKNISRLKDLNLLRRAGHDRGGHWEVINEED